MNAVGRSFKLPPDKEATLQRAKRVEWASIAFLLSIVLVLGLVMGASQAMKAMWTEDLLSLVPSTSFLVGAHFRKKPPDEEFPYGYRTAVRIGFLTGAVALFGFGIYLLGDSLLKLIEAKHPTIQTIGWFGTRVWLGWLMIAALTYSVIPPFVLGRMKLPLARELHDKVLQVSATLDKGDWLAGLAGLFGILGIAYGLWWADGAAAAFISVEIIKDGWENLKNAVEQLMNKRPSDVETKEHDPVVDKLQEALQKLEWVQEARVRLREQGDILTGEAFLQVRDDHDLLARLEQARDIAGSIGWRMHDAQAIPVRTLV